MFLCDKLIYLVNSTVKVLFLSLFLAIAKAIMIIYLYMKLLCSCFLTVYFQTCSPLKQPEVNSLTLQLA